MQKELLKKYVALDAKFKQIEEEKKALREEIVADFKKNKIEKVESDFGSFTICSKASWSYSPKIKALEEKIKIAKDVEQKKGIAESSISEYLLFKSNE